jgi:hypothetical protein
MLTLADGKISPLVANAIPWGRASVRGVSFNRHRQGSSRPRRCHAHGFGVTCVQCTLGGEAVRRAPKPGPVRGDLGDLFDLV